MYKFKQSKENARWVELYENSRIISLKQCYKNINDIKWSVDKIWREEAGIYSGSSEYKILTYNKRTYTAGFLNYNPENGIQYLTVYTAFNKYDIAYQILDLAAFIKFYNIDKKDNMDFLENPPLIDEKYEYKRYLKLHNRIF